jgi:hypothetical protein
MNRPGINAQNMAIYITLRSIPMTIFQVNSFVNIYAVPEAGGPIFIVKV